MKTLLLLNCYLFLIGYSSANDNGGNCKIENISDLDYETVFTMNIDDTQIDIPILEYTYSGKLEIVEYPPSDYFTITRNDTHFIIRTTPLFGEFDERTKKQTESFVLDHINVTLGCADGNSTLLIQIAINDINTHAPVFSHSDYEFRVAAPIMPLTDFSIYGDAPITATDIDFSNQNIVFTVTPEDFNITTISSSTSKEYSTVFRAKRVIQVTGVTKYVITATDTGTNPGPLSSSTTFSLIVDEATSVDTPTFVNPSYSFNYTDDDGTPKLIPLDETISIMTNKRNFLTDPELTGSFNEHFDATVNKAARTIDLAPNGLLPTDTGSFFILTLSISTDNTATASIIVYRDQPEVDNSPKFSRHVYTGSYDGQVTLTDDIVVTSATLPDVSISGAYSDNFKVAYDEETKSYQISVIANLTGPEIKSLSYLNVMLIATADEKFDTAALILKLPEHELHFTDALYTATYNSDNTITMDDTKPIAFTTDTVNVAITIAGSYGDNFNITYNAKNNQYSLLVIKPLPSEILKTEELIELILTASDSYEDEAQSVVSIHLPNINTDAPAFSETVYLLEYTDNDIGSTLQLDHDISIINRETQDTIKISLDSYNTNFEVDYNKAENKWELKLLSPLPDDVILSRNDILITLTAEEPDNANKGHAVLSISWITQKAPIFSEVYYQGHYFDNETGVIKLATEIDITNVKDPSNVVISLDSYSEYFEITYSSNKWIVTQILPTSPIVDEYEELVIILTAKEAGNKNVGQSVLVLDIPEEKQPPMFSDAYYMADYPASGTGMIEFANPIKFLNVNDPSTIQISLDNFASNFEIKYEADRWYINIKSGLDDAILHRNIELVMTLIATENGNVNKGESALVLNLPTALIGTAPKFSEAYYIANYPETGIGLIEFETDISFLNVDDLTSLTITLDKYANNFDIIYQSKKWYINITNSLDNAVLHQNVDLAITIYATEKGNANKGESALVLNLPTATYGTALKFSDAYYIANYPESGNGVIEFNTAVSFLNVENPADVTITLDKYTANFNVIYDTNQFFINIKNSLDHTVLHQNVELVMTLTATEPGNQSQGESALILKLPTASNGTAPKFSEAYYQATYPAIGTGIIEFDTPIKFINVDEPSSIKITLDNYADNFEILFDDEKGWYINIKNSLGIDVLQRTEIVATLIAKVVGSSDEGESAFVLKLPTANNETAPKFLKAYYVAKYPKTGRGSIEFENPIEFLNVENELDLTISLDNYTNNFEITYGANGWFINIKDSLDESILDNNVELVMTLVAKKLGSDGEGLSALVLNLPTKTNNTAPEFEEAYYLAEYPEIDTDIIEFENAIKFKNIDNPQGVTISLDNYFENFDISYDSNRWYIAVKDNLDQDILNRNAELVLTMTASESGNINKGYSALVIKLPAATRTTAPIFSEAYYLAEYPKSGTGSIEFQNPIEFTNVDDPQDIKISLSDYSENFGVIYNNKRWYINIAGSLNDTVLNRNKELVMTLTATRSDDGSEGHSALVLKLPAAISSPEFAEAYYLAEYPESGTGIIEFENHITFFGEENPENLKISLDSYLANFAILYGSDRWYISITQSLDDAVLRNTELVMTMIATENGNDNEGETALVLKLPTINNDKGPLFSKAHYEAEYTEDGTGFIEFEESVIFVNVGNPTTVTINLDSYANNFDIMYGTDRWVIKLKTNLNDSILTKNTEIVMTMVASEVGKTDKGYSALVLKLPSANSATAPKFADAYYLADYSMIIGGIIHFENPLKFLNVDDPTSVKISLDYYSENFEIQFDTDAWYINVIKSLNSSVTSKKSEIVMTMIATELGSDKEGVSALVLKLPTISDEEGPIFAEAHYEAEYTEDGNGNIEFDNAVTFLNVHDPTAVTISLDIYSSNFDIIYGLDRWYIKLKTNLDNSVLLKNAEIVMTMSAAEIGNNNKGYSALILKLPSANIVKAPRFSEAYYLADYSKITKGTIEFESPLTFLNVEDLTAVTISLDYYSDYFEIAYETGTDKWHINVNKNLDSNVLNKNTELIMTMIATETGNNNAAESALVLKLPTIADETGPIFSEAYYEAKYTEGGIIEFDSAVTFQNVDDITTVTINVDTYSDNFDIIYGSDRWFIKLKSKLDSSILTKNTEIVMTMTANEAGNKNKGYSALVLKLPSASSAIAPKFSEAYYLADYSKISKEIIEFGQPITFLNVDDPTAVTISLDNYSNNFKVAYNKDTGNWYIHVINVLNNTVLRRNTELVMTMIATELGNDNEGESVLVLKLPIVTEEAGPIFAEAFYEAEYRDDGIGIIEFNNAVKFLNVDDVTTITISLDKFSNNFDIVYGTNGWYIRVKTNLDRNILLKNTEITITMIATTRDNANESHSALIVKLPSAKSVTAPKFSEAYYLADYSKITGGTLEFENPIQFLNIYDATTVKVTLDYYSNNFEIAYSTRTARWYININDRLDNDVLTKNAELVMTMIATERGNDNAGEAALVLKLPNVTDAEGPVFAEAYYEAEYKEDGAGIIEFENALMFLNVHDPTTLTISLDNYSNNFNVIYDVNTLKWYIRIKTKLEPSVLMKNTEIVMTMTATVADNKNKGNSALVLKLPAANSATAPKFSEAYYSADYSKITGGNIEFDSPIQFINVDDVATVTIRLDYYSNNFDITYDKNLAKWYIKVIDTLDNSVLSKNAELVMTMIASETENDNEGEAALVLKLPIISNETAPIFSEAHYEVEYTGDGTGIIEFKNPLKFLNIDDPAIVTIDLDSYSNNFGIVYSSSRWYIQIKKSLDESILKKNTEIVATMTATVVDSRNEGHSALIFKLPSANTVTAPKFSETYYLADYSTITRGVIEFENPVTFVNVEDPTKITISLDIYSDNFHIAYNTDKNMWYISVIKTLNNNILNENAELVITMIATEVGNDNEGQSALVLKLPSITDETGPIFSEAYYEAEYAEDTEFMEFETDILFLNVEDPKTVTINLDNYSDNFNVTYGANKWYLMLKTNLDESVLMKNTEIVMTMTARETGNRYEGHSALVLKLPSANIDAVPKFSEAYYVANYSKMAVGIIEFENPIKFVNADPSAVTISLDNYSDWFDIIYDTDGNRWYIDVKHILEEDVLSKNAELVMTMTATKDGNKHQGYSTLVLELPTSKAETAPLFSDAYYLADYPENGEVDAKIEVSIAFKNVDVPSKVAITLDNYVNNFIIDFVSNKWYLTIKIPLNETVLEENTELVMSLIATENDKSSKGYSALVLKIPTATVETPPIFSKPVYPAEYKISNGKAIVEFADAISVTSKTDLLDISISVDNYPDNFNVLYDTAAKTWVMNVKTQIPDDILLSKTDIVVALKATDKTNGLTGQSVVDLKLPPLNIETSPRFSKTFYTAKYTISGATPMVTFDVPLEITNRDNLADISISIDPFADHFNIIYDLPHDEWKMDVTRNLDESVLNAKVDLVMALLATDKTTGEIGMSALVLTLPIVNNNEAPKFSRIYYSGEYKIDNGGTVELENLIEIKNKNNLSAITISFDESYKSNFEIAYNSINSKWILSTLSPLNDSITKEDADLILTITATETNNSNIGQAALLLHLPLSHVKEIPKFDLSHYSAEYEIKDDQATVHLNNTITISNKEDFDDISVTLDNDPYAEYFIISPEADKYVVTVKNALPPEVLNSEVSIPLTIIASVDTSASYATLVINLPRAVKEGAIKFKSTLYSGKYLIDDDSFEVADTIQVETDEDDGNIKPFIASDTGYEEYFEITYATKTVTVTAKQIPSNLLNGRSVIPLLLTVGIVGTSDSSTAVLNVKIERNEDDYIPILFSNVLYHGKYEVIDGVGDFTVDDAIKIETDEADENVEVSISSEYETYFAISYSNKVISVTLRAPLPSSILESHSFIPLTLQVGIKETTNQASAVLNVEIKYDSDVDVGSIEFSTVLYGGEYSVIDGKGHLALNQTIQVITDSSDDKIVPTISNGAGYDKYFTIAYADNVVSLGLADESLPNDVLANSVIALKITLAIKETTHSSSAVVNINIDNEKDYTPISFSNLLYHGIYEVTDGVGDFSIDGDIKIETDEADENVEVSISNEYETYFAISYSNKVISVTLRAPLPSSILQSHSFIPLTLQVGIKGTTNQASAVLNVEIKYDSDIDVGSIEFSTVLYGGEYSVIDGKGQLTLNQTIQVITDSSDDKIVPTISNGDGYNKYFTIAYADNVVSLGLADESLPNDVLANSVIALKITLAIKETTHSSSAVVNINIDNEKDYTPISFSNLLYHGIYEVTDGVGDFKIDDDIKIETDEADGNVDVSISKEYETYFAISYSNKVISVTLRAPLPSSILESHSFIPLTLQVGIKGTTNQASAVLNVEIKYDSDIDVGSIEFSTVLYGGEYSVIDGKGQLMLNQTIQVITDSSDDKIVPTISNGDGYNKYFTIAYADNVVSLGLADESLPNDVLANSVIALKITLAIKETTHSSSAVVNINIDNEKDYTPISFSNLLYHGIYEVTDGVGDFKIDDDIKIETDEADGNVDVSISKEYETYFAISYSNKVISVTLRAPLPSSILESHSFIPLTLQVGIKGTTNQASAVLNVEIKYDSDVDVGAIEFSTVLYGGEYSVIDGKGHLALNQTIQVITDSSDDKIVPTISNGAGYDKYFTIAYADNVVSLGLADESLPNDVLANSVIALKITLAIKETTHSSSAVVNINIDNEKDYTPISFSNLLYHGIYEVTDGVGDFSIDGDIKIETDEADENVEVSISNEYETYFAISYSNKVISVTLRAPLPSSILESHSFIPLTLQVGIKGTTNQASAVLNVEIKYDGDIDVGSIEFSTVLYGGEYFVVDGTGHLTLNQTIKVTTDSSDDKIVPTISNGDGYDKYFTIAYANNVVSIGLADKSLPKDVLANSFIAIKITLAIKETTHSSSAVLNINIVSDDDDDDDNNDNDCCPMRTAYLVSIIFLSILVVALIAAAIAFYYFKLRNKNYANLDEERDSRARYERNNPQGRAPSDAKHTPLDQRRPTGFIFKPLEEDAVTDTTNDFDKNRRKSVAFDDKIEKLQIESPIDEDNISVDDNNISDKSEVTHV